MSMIDSDEPAIQKVDGRTKEGRAARAAEVQGVAPARANPRANTRTANRDASREATRLNGQAVGRDGTVLTRKRTGGTDPFTITPDMIESGWDMQWIALSVVGNAEVVQDQLLGMVENGWRPVPANRFPGRFMPAGYTGLITRGGQGLYERPLALSQQARAEDIRAAKQLINDRDQSLMGLKAKMPDGFDMSRRYRGTGGEVKMSIDRALDIEPPSHQLADPGE